jgi:hypothetical protein
LGHDTLGFYGVQFRQYVRGIGNARLEPFVTYGAMGVFYREYSGMAATPPILGFVGGGLQQRIARRAAVRVEAQGIAAFVIPVGVRVAAGVSVPIGRLSP